MADVCQTLYATTAEPVAVCADVGKGSLHHCRITGIWEKKSSLPKDGDGDGGGGGGGIG